MTPKKLILSFVALAMLFSNAFAAKSKSAKQKNSVSEQSKITKIPMPARSSEKKVEAMIFDEAHINAAIEDGNCAFFVRVRAIGKP